MALTSEVWVVIMNQYPVWFWFLIHVVATLYSTFWLHMVCSLFPIAFWISSSGARYAPAPRKLSFNSFFSVTLHKDYHAIFGCSCLRLFTMCKIRIYEVISTQPAGWGVNCLAAPSLPRRPAPTSWVIDWASEGSNGFTRAWWFLLGRHADQ